MHQDREVLTQRQHLDQPLGVIGDTQRQALTVPDADRILRRYVVTLDLHDETFERRIAVNGMAENLDKRIVALTLDRAKQRFRTGIVSSLASLTSTTLASSWYASGIIQLVSLRAAELR